MGVCVCGRKNWGGVVVGKVCVWEKEQGWSGCKRVFKRRKGLSGREGYLCIHEYGFNMA